MSLIALCSAHGSPGVTTTALTLAATWPEERRCLLVEADPFGGVTGARYGLSDTPGMASLAAVARRGLDEEVVWLNAQQLPGGVDVLVGPGSADEAHAVLRDVAGILADWATDHGEIDVIVDCGRLAPTLATLDVVVTKADVAMVLTRPSLDQLRPAAHRLAALEASGAEVSLLLVGDEPYGRDEVAAAVRGAITGVIAWDPRTAAVLVGTRGTVRDLRRSPLVRSVATLSADLASSLPGSGRDTTGPELRVRQLDAAEQEAGG
jgi:MinD-like ATPase involved in chromosome partitioning or flagellar assembly